MNKLKWKTINKDIEWRMIITSKYYLKILQEYITVQPPLPIFMAYLCIRGKKAYKYYSETADITVDEYIGRYLSLENAKNKAPIAAYLKLDSLQVNMELAKTALEFYGENK